MPDDCWADVVDRPAGDFTLPAATDLARESGRRSC
jgi:hypothetical protein